MANKEQDAVKIDVRAYPILEPKSNTVAFASVTINDMFAVNGIRVVSGDKGNFVAMPQTKDAKGEYRDIAFPVTATLRKRLNEAVLGEYAAAIEKGAQEKTSVREQIKEGAKTDKPATKEKATKSKAVHEH